MPHTPLPHEVPDENDHRPVPSFSGETLEEASALNKAGQTAEAWGLLAQEGDRYANRAQQMVELDEFLEQTFGRGFGNREDRQAQFDNYVALSYGREKDGRFQPPTEEEVLGSYRSLKDSYALPERVDRLGLPWNPVMAVTEMHPDRRGKGSGEYARSSLQHNLGRDSDGRDDTYDGSSSLQHDLGRDAYGNDDTTENPQTPASDAEAYGGGEFGSGDGLSGFQHDLGSDGYGNDDTSQNPSTNPSNNPAEHGDTTPGSQFGQEKTEPQPEPDPEPDPGGPGGGDPGGGKPIVLDLDGDGLELVALEDSTAFYDINGDGYRERMAWASADDGFLAYDKDGDGIISAHDELSFVSYVEGARTDLEGLAHFDTNGNGQLDSGDTEWSKFRVWQDLDQDGVSDPGELQTLAEAGITSISLTSDGVEQTVAGNTVFGEGSYTDAEGSQSFFDVALQHSEWGIREDADGNVTVGSGGDALLHIAGPTTEAERRLDAAALGVVGIIGHDTTDRLTAAPEGSLLVGAGGDDTLLGGAGDDWLQGDGGADTLRGGGGSDILIVDADDFATGEVDGGAGFDIAMVSGDTGVTVDLATHELEAIQGSGGDDTFSTSGSDSVFMFGEGGADTLTGGAGDDVLSGGAGADTLRAGAGDDVLFVDADDFATGAVDGGTGRDTAFVEGSTGVTVNLATHNLEMLFGSSGADTLSTSGAAGVLIDGGAGNDAITGGGGNDSLFGSAGDDTVTGGAGNDVLDGGAGADTLRGGSGNDLYRFGRGGGRDTIRDASGSGDVLYLHGDIGIADIRLRMKSGKLEIALKDPDKPSAAFDDLADRATIENWSSSGARIEVIAFGDGSLLNLTEVVQTYNVRNGGAAVDLIAAMTAAWGYRRPQRPGEVYQGGAGNDILAGGPGNDLMSGGAGNDTLWGGSSGNDELHGGAGDDRYVFGRGDGRDTIMDKHISGGAPVRAGTADELVLRGDISIADIMLRLNDGPLKLLEIALKEPDNPGAAFDDLADRISIWSWTGYRGYEQVEFITFGDGSRLDLRELVRTYGVVKGGPAVDLIAAMAAAHKTPVPAGGHAYLGGSGDDTLVGSAGNDIVSGGAGDDVLAGGAGDDTLTGGAGADTLWGDGGDDLLVGGAGADRLNGGAGSDTASYSFSAAGVSVNLADGAASGGDAAGDTFSGIENLEGSAHADTLAGDANANRLSGGAGNDTLTGGGGDDVLTGGAGADVLTGGAGSDTASYRSSAAGVSVDLSKGAVSGGDAEGDTLSGIENLEGSAHADTLTGDANANRLSGGAGDDTLTGGGGDDVLTGGGGADALDGGAGSDTASWAGSAARVSVDLSKSTARAAMRKATRFRASRTSKARRMPTRWPAMRTRTASRAAAGTTC